MDLEAEKKNAFVESPKVGNSNFILLVGASQSGKSSFLTRWLLEADAQFENGISSERKNKKT